MISTISVPLPSDKSYPIYIGSGLLENNDYLKKHITSSRVMIVTNTTIAPLYLETLLMTLDDYHCDTVIIPDGESYKTWDQLTTIFNALIEKGHDRSTTLIALGGGVVGDMTGFAASVYMRGLPFIQIPTSLLAQVDASVGGKTAVNHPLSKNLLGAFYQPECVLIDPNTLFTLPERELRSGLAEVIKHALIADALFFEWLENHMDTLLAKDQPSIQYAIERCCQIKARIVSEDEHEHHIRAWLNLGHTFAHAIEHLTHYQWIHGEAVAVGLVLAAELSEQKGLLPLSSVSRITQLVQKAKLPTQPPLFAPGAYWDAMLRDKKNKAGCPTFILLEKIGVPLICTGSHHGISKSDFFTLILKKSPVFP